MVEGVGTVATFTGTVETLATSASEALATSAAGSSAGKVSLSSSIKRVIGGTVTFISWNPEDGFDTAGAVVLADAEATSASSAYLAAILLVRKSTSSLFMLDERGSEDGNAFGKILDRKPKLENELKDNSSTIPGYLKGRARDRLG